MATPLVTADVSDFHQMVTDRINGSLVDARKRPGSGAGHGRVHRRAGRHGAQACVVPRAGAGACLRRRVNARIPVVLRECRE